MEPKRAQGLIVILIVLLHAPFAASQQDVERGIKETERHLREEVEKKLEPQTEKPSVTIEKERKEEKKEAVFFIKEIRLTGCESLLPAAFKDLISEYENKESSLTELTTLAKNIEKRYLKNGFLAACFVPPQEIKDGVVVLRVIESRMGRLEVVKHKYFDNDRLGFYWEIPEGEIIRYGKISRSLQLMNESPDREVKATLSAGKKPGTTDIRLDAETYLPIHSTASFDREGAVSTGKNRFGVGGRDNNFLFLDDTLISGTVFGREFSSVYAYHRVPISYRGTSVMYGFSKSEAFPKKDFEAFDIRSYSNSASISLRQDIFGNEKKFGDMYITIDGNDKTVYTNNGVLNKDRLRVLRLGSDIVFRGSASASEVKAEFSQGLDLLGARRKNPLSSRDVEDTFSKITFGLRHIVRFLKGIRFDIKTNCQLASEKLAPQEEFSLGGINSVRGYPSADYYADNAIQTNMELLVPPAFLPDSIKLPFAERPLKESIDMVLFVDHGYGFRRGKDQGEKNLREMASVGVGLRIRLYEQLVLRLEWGFPITALADNPLSESAVARFHISLDFEDNILQRLAR